MNSANGQAVIEKLRPLPVDRQPRFALKLALPVALCIGAGCISSKVASSPPSTPISLAPVAAPADRSLPVKDYIRMGMPAPDHFWTVSDYRACRDVLYQLDRTSRAAMPRLDSSLSGPVFARLVNSTNTLPLVEPVLPASERINFFYALINLFPVFLNLYNPSSIEPVLSPEALQLHHTYLRMLRSAVELDGQPLPPAKGETGVTIFQVSEASDPYFDIKWLGDSPYEDDVVPGGDQLSIVGAFCANSVGELLPWLADGTGLNDTERLAAIHYLDEDVPPLWRHILAATQRDLLEELEETLRGTHHEEVRRELELLRRQLPSP